MALRGKDIYTVISCSSVMKIAVAGCGNMGRVLAMKKVSGELNVEIVGYYDVVTEMFSSITKIHNAEVFKTIDELICSDADTVVEVASQEFVRRYAEKILSSGKNLVVMSVGAFMDRELLDRVKKTADNHGKKVYIPSGAVAGLDGLKAINTEKITDAVLKTVKPVSGFQQSEYLSEKGIELNKIKEKTLIFKGSADEAVQYFPKNINVAALISLALGRTINVEIYADPMLKRNTHTIEVCGDFGCIRSTTENEPSPDNPKTSYLAPLSLISALNNIAENMVIAP